MNKDHLSQVRDDLNDAMWHLDQAITASEITPEQFTKWSRLIGDVHALINLTFQEEE